MDGKAVELKQSTEYLANTDPFEIPLDRYRTLTSDENWIVTNRLYALYEDWLERKFMEHSAESLVLCDKKVVYASKNRYEPSDEQITELEAQIGKPCYVVTREPLLEERAGWSQIQRDDYYPTLEVYVGDRDWNGGQVFSEGKRIKCSYFDTGNRDYTVLDADDCRDISSNFPRVMRIGRHLGWIYHFYPCQMKVGITDGEKGRCLSKIVEGVENREIHSYQVKRFFR